jgi:NAD(P)-dependent dehydrogenase (short-subunit alcohol dehydrogenase family)
VSSEAGIAALVEAVKSRTNELHILVNKCRRGLGRAAEDISLQGLEQGAQRQRDSRLPLTRELLPLLKGRDA